MDKPQTISDKHLASYDNDHKYDVQSNQSNAQVLSKVGLRPTRQRKALADLLFAKGDRHLTAEDLHIEAVQAGVPVSLATVYNTLHQFNEAGLLRVLAIEGQRTYFDTDTSDHHHFFVEETGDVIDIPGCEIAISNLPCAPSGMEISNVDVVIRVKHTKNETNLK